MGRRDIVIPDKKNRGKNRPLDAEDHARLYRFMIKQLKSSGKSQGQAEAVVDVVLGRQPKTKPREEMETLLASLFNEFPEKPRKKTVFQKIKDILWLE